MGSVGFQLFDLEELRRQLRAMPDEYLLRYGRAGANLCRPHNGEAPRPEFVVQLREERREWRRRFPKQNT